MQKPKLRGAYSVSLPHVQFTEPTGFPKVRSEISGFGEHHSAKDGPIGGAKRLPRLY